VSALTVLLKKKDGSAALSCRRADGSVTWQRQWAALGAGETLELRFQVPSRHAPPFP
jgi:hypothetical protein